MYTFKLHNMAERVVPNHYQDIPRLDVWTDPDYDSNERYWDGLVPETRPWIRNQLSDMLKILRYFIKKYRKIKRIIIGLLIMKTKYTDMANNLLSRLTGSLPEQSELLGATILKVVELAESEKMGNPCYGYDREFGYCHEDDDWDLPGYDISDSKLLCPFHDPDILPSLEWFRSLVGAAEEEARSNEESAFYGDPFNCWQEMIEASKNISKMREEIEEWWEKHRSYKIFKPFDQLIQEILKISDEIDDVICECDVKIQDLGDLATI